MSHFSTDLLRVLAANFIIFNHSFWMILIFAHTKDETWFTHIVIFFNQLGKPSVLFFFFLSGYAFTINDRKLYKNIWSFLTTRSLRIIPPYVIVSLLGTLVLGSSLVYFLKGLTNGANFFHLYFIPLIFLMYLLYPLLRKIQYNYWILAFLCVLAITSHLFVLMSNVVPLFSETFIFANWFHYDFYLDKYQTFFMWTEYICFGLFYFCIGIWFAQKNFQAVLDPKKRLWRYIFFVLAFIFVLSEFYFYTYNGLSPDTASRIWRPTVLIYGLAYIVLFQTFRQRNSTPWLRKAARASFLVYLIHPFFLHYAAKWMPGYYFEWRYFFITLVTSWGSALLLLKLSHKLNWFGFFIGEGKSLFQKRNS